MAGLAAALAIPALVTAGGFLTTARHQLTSGLVPVNLIRPLSVWQVVGIWPSGDFRFRPGQQTIAYVLIAVALVAAAWGCSRHSDDGEAELPLYVGTALVGGGILASFGSAWVDAKVLTTASPAILSRRLPVRRSCSTAGSGSLVRAWLW